MRRETLIRSVVATLSLALVSGVALAQQKSEDKDTKQKPRASSAAKPAAKDAGRQEASKLDADEDGVFTNEDLERMMEGLSPYEARAGVYQAKAQPDAAGPSAENPDGKESPDAKGKGEPAAPADSENRVAALQARVAELEKAVLAVKNPLLPRNWTTPESTKEQDAESGYDAKSAGERLAQREEELRAAREELDRARQELASQRAGKPTP